MSDVPKTMVQTALISRVALLIENLTYPECGIPLDCKEWIEKLKSIAFILEEELSQSATALAQSQARVAELEKALGIIEQWTEFPATGDFHKGGTPVSYGAAFGSNGERDYMRGIARKALKDRA